MKLSHFGRAVSITLSHEKGYVFDPDDPGGETKYGISARQYPRLNIKALTVDGAKTIYRMDYWQKPGFHRLADVAPDLAVKCFDLGVNCGQQTAVKFLQRAVNVVCWLGVEPRRAAAWRQEIVRLLAGKVLKVDGLLGPVTLAVIGGCPYHGALMAALKGEAYKHYADGNPRYIAGWLERLEKQ